MEKADLNSFEILKPVSGINKFFETRWARDKNHVYYSRYIVEGADPETVVVLNQHHARDKEHYIMGQYALKNDSTLIFYPNLMAKNKEAVYHKDGRKFIYADAESFSYLNEFYQKDKDYVFCEGKEMLEADITTFKVVGKERFGYDKKLAFFGRNPIKMADINTWEWLADYYSKDHQNVFYYHRKVKGADAATFKVIDMGEKKIGEDKKGKYINGRLVDEAKIQKWLKKD